eukprot:Awhi_evm1s13510
MNNNDIGHLKTNLDQSDPNLRKVDSYVSDLIDKPWDSDDQRRNIDSDLSDDDIDDEDNRCTSSRLDANASNKARAILGVRPFIPLKASKILDIPVTSTILYSRAETLTLECGPSQEKHRRKTLPENMMFRKGSFHSLKRHVSVPNKRKSSLKGGELIENIQYQSNISASDKKRVLKNGVSFLPIEPEQEVLNPKARKLLGLPPLTAQSRHSSLPNGLLGGSCGSESESEFEGDEGDDTEQREEDPRALLRRQSLARKPSLVRRNSIERNAHGSHFRSRVNSILAEKQEEDEDEESDSPQNEATCPPSSQPTHSYPQPNLPTSSPVIQQQNRKQKTLKKLLRLSTSLPNEKKNSKQGEQDNHDITMEGNATEDEKPRHSSFSMRFASSKKRDNSLQLPPLPPHDLYPRRSILKRSILEMDSNTFNNNNNSSNSNNNHKNHFKYDKMYTNSFNLTTKKVAIKDRQVHFREIVICGQTYHRRVYNRKGPKNVGSDFRFLSEAKRMRIMFPVEECLDELFPD